MAKVSVRTPVRQVGKGPYVFKVKDGDGKDGDRIVGHLEIRESTVNWFTKGEKTGMGISWREFDDLMMDYRKKRARRG